MQTSFYDWLVHGIQTRPVCSVVVVVAGASRRNRDLCRQIAATGADQINVHRTFYTHRPSYCNMLIMKSASHSKNWFRLYFVFVLISLIILGSRIIRSWKSLRADEDAIYDKTIIMFKLFLRYMSSVQALNRYWNVATAAVTADLYNASLFSDSHICHQLPLTLEAQTTFNREQQQWAINRCRLFVNMLFFSVNDLNWLNALIL